MNFNNAAIKNTGGISNFMIITLVLATLFVIGAGLYYLFRRRPDHVTVNGPYNLKGITTTSSGSDQVTILDSSQLLSSTGNNFTISAFVYMDEVNAERIPLAGPDGDFRFKPLIYILGVGTIILDPIHQKARVSLLPLTDKLLNSNNAVLIDVDNFLVGRWNMITISILGRSADVYLNGKLIKSAMLSNVPVLAPVGLLLETIPDFSGQAGLFQAWARRLSSEEVYRNYKMNTDLRGKPNIKIEGLTWGEVWENFKSQLCKVGFCGFNYKVGPLAYVDYEYA